MEQERSEAARAFLARAGWEGASVAALPGDASTRRYFRVRRNGSGVMLMDQLDTERALVIRKDDKGAVNLQVLPLP